MHTQTKRTPLQTFYELVKLGDRISTFEVAAAYSLPLFYFTSELFWPLFSRNAATQAFIFLFVCQIPLYITGKMCYVDIAWPYGLVALAANCFFFGSGWIVRKTLVCSCLLFHGGRMALGATVLFFPFTFPHGDLSRYKYAKAKWIREGLDPGLWWIKAQQETLTQCLANCVILACPFYILCSDPTPHLRLFEVIGLAFWALSSLYENIADTQKLAFLALAKIGTPEQKSAMKTGVLGMPPFDGPLYKLWTFSRHPNYCGEFGCWVGFALTALPSIFGWIAMKQGHTVAAVLLFNSWLVIRFFYDCLVHWTGAGPAEQASIQKRPEYKIYQKSTPVLFPFRIPFLSSHQVSGWPNAIENPKSD